MIYQGRFIQASSGHLYLGCFGELTGRDVWLYLPPFAEEMNLSRSIVARQARAFTECGEAAVCLDYVGTGDSEGEIEQATIEHWLNDIGETIDWITAQGARCVNLWGLRFGGLMAMHYLAENPDSSVKRLLLWRPVLDGKLMMNQFFRLKQVSESMKGGAKVNWLEKARQGETIEVAGYPISAALLESISALKAAPAWPAGFPNTLWLEAGAEKISSAVEKYAAHWPASRLRLQACPAPAFWQNPDCYQAPELIDQTLSSTPLTQRVADVC
ncbi:MAG: exosortase A-associated hydrolase 2 [Motiliproteus sp.]|jgi:exosortase A-associated hydrolase 2